MKTLFAAIVVGALVFALGVAGCAATGDKPAPQLEKTLTIKLAEGIKMEFVLIRPGSFMMGSEKGNANEKPVHKVTLTKPFYMGRFEVTQEQWKTVMGSNPSNFKGDKNPMDSVSWDDCQTFLRRLAEKAPSQKFRLPTEAEWEYACRAGSTSAFCYGDDEGGLKDYAWYRGNAENKTHPAGEKKANAWGLYDMCGNVCEWCHDWYADKYPDGGQTDPSGPATGQGRVLRNGTWQNYPTTCRSAARSWTSPGYRLSIYGFRVVCAAGVD